MELEKIKEIIRRKPTFFIMMSLGYLFVTALLKWFTHPSLDTLLFMAGGGLGIFFMDIAEVFFDLNPSPFRGMLFFAAFLCVSFFIITSSGSALASGLVLSLYLTILLWQFGEWNIHGNVNSWYRMIAVPIPVKTQQWVLLGSLVIFLVQTFLFVR